MTAEILTERQDAGVIGIVTLNRPQRHNALNLAMWRGCAAAVRALGADAAVRVIIVRGAGERAFASGADLTELPTDSDESGPGTGYGAAVEDALAAIAQVAQPVIAMIHGYCIGGGCELAIACDLRIADDRARFGIPAAKLGVVLGIGELRALLNVVGIAVAKEILFTGRLLDADEARAAGLVTRVVPPADLAETTLALARTIAANSPASVAAAKGLLNALAGDAAPDEIAAARAAFAGRASRSGDRAEGVNAFREKRSPRFAAPDASRPAGESV